MIEILYEDKSIIVCVKPSGMLSERSDDAKSLPMMIERERGLSELFVVHRLDREVFGVMVYAKDSTSAQKLSRAIAERKFDKEYLAIVEGKMDEKEGVLKDLLLRDQRKNKTYVVDRKRKGVKDASLEYETLGKAEGSSLLRIKLHTGRTHQIRVQFASRGCPIEGDRKYGSRVKAQGIALCSYKVGFENPESGRYMSFRYLPMGNEAWTRFDKEINGLDDR